MKYLLNGVVIVAALAIAAPAWAQRSGPGPNAPEYPNYPNAGVAGTGAPTPPPATTSASPPMHRHARHTAAHKGSATMRHGPTSTTDTTAQLNRQELARVQGGGGMMPPPASGPAPSGRMPAPH